MRILFPGKLSVVQRIITLLFFKLIYRAFRRKVYAGSSTFATDPFHDRRSPVQLRKIVGPKHQKSRNGKQQ